MTSCHIVNFVFTPTHAVSGVTNYRNHRELPKSPKNLPKSPQNVPKSPAHLKDIYLLVSKM